MKPWPVSCVRPWVGLWARAGTAMAIQSKIARKGLVKDISEANLKNLLWRQKGARRMWSQGFISSPIRKNGDGGSENVGSSIKGRRTGDVVSSSGQARAGRQTTKTDRLSYLR